MALARKPVGIFTWSAHPGDPAFKAQILYLMIAVWLPEEISGYS
jgi:hypothetical protein